MNIFDLIRAYNHACVSHDKEQERSLWIQILKRSLTGERTHAAK
jgi:hypothetical protein